MLAHTSSLQRPVSAARIALVACGLSLIVGSGSALAQASAPSVLQVQDAWVRATTKGQQATGMFATLTAPQGATLVGASSPVAGTVEVHEMKMDGNVMRMRAVPQLPLPAGQAVALKPGSYHVMLMNLKQALPAGGTVPVTLLVEDAQKKRQQVELKVPVRGGMGAEAGKDQGKGQGHHHGHDHDHDHHSH